MESRLDTTAAIKEAAQFEKRLRDNKIEIPIKLKRDHDRAKSELAQASRELQSLFDKGFSSTKDVDAYRRAFEEVTRAATKFEKVMGKTQELKLTPEKLLPRAALNRYDLLEKSISAYEKAQKQAARTQVQLQNENTAHIQAANNALEEQQKHKKALEAQETSYIEKLEETKKAIEAIKAYAGYNSETKEFSSWGRVPSGMAKGGQRVSEDVRKENEREILRLLEEEKLANEGIIATKKGIEAQSAKIVEAEQNHEAAIKNSQITVEEWQKNATTLYGIIVKTFKEAGVETKDLGTNATQLNRILAETKNSHIEQLKVAFESAGVSLADFLSQAQQYNVAIDEMGKKTLHFEEATSQIDNFMKKLTVFFGVDNLIRLARRTWRQAMQAISELDSVMTETAVVTDYSISDMWSKLPEYTKAANRLGSTIKDMYAATTLLYQQGLNTNEVFGMGVEIMKMARIAGLDAAKATDLLTSAVRGFQMALDEGSAQRVSDVYANLAAKSASNVQELSIAMSKVAALAHSTGMSFETTAAFLAQGIETTREPAESLGTALKTVVARFAELKKPLEEIGEVDGEIVDANRVEGALRSVGIALRDSSGQFRDLDSVMKEISAKWGDMDLMQQRYIATMAAGSRQQIFYLECAS